MSKANKTLISIIVPIYNAQHYINTCIESIINQEYPNIEIILVDDGSTDGSSALCDKWANRCGDKIMVIHQENQGASIARKNGIALAKGEYLTFVDSDDYVVPQYVSGLYRAAIGTNTKVAVCPFLNVRPNENYSLETIPLPVIQALTQHEIFKRFFKYEFWAFWGAIYHKSLFDNLIFPTATVNEDYFVKAQIFSKVDRVGYYPRPLYIYEKHPGSLSNQYLSLKALGEFDNAYATWKFISEHNAKYKNQALAIVSEVAYKWLRAINKNERKNKAILKYKTNIRDFVYNNFANIFLNQSLLWKLKVMLLLELTNNCFK